MYEALEVKAPMTGRVASIPVQVGGTVLQGDVLITLEAMKMENQVRAPRPGVVIEVLTTEGAIVHSGDLLAVLD
ncbi:MAG: acetyl-CoA carboxylase biotin carboxyl carrier protein subunit [Desulfovermiculus sp.]